MKNDLISNFHLMHDQKYKLLENTHLLVLKND